MKRDYYSDSFFFYPHELTKIVLKSSTKYYCTKLHYLAQRTEPKWFYLFFRVTYQTGRDQRVPPFNFFRHCETFFLEIFFRFFPQRVPPAFFWCFATQWMLENPKGFPLSVFFGIVRFFPENKKKISSIFFMFCDRMDVEKPQRVPPFSFSALWDFSAPGARASGPRRATWSIFLVCNFFKKKNFRKIFDFRVL